MDIRSALKRVAPVVVINGMRAVKERYRVAQRYQEIAGPYRAHRSDRRPVPAGWPLPRRRVLFYPEFPVPDSISYKLCALHGYGMTCSPQQPFDVAFKRLDATQSDPAVLDPLSRTGCPIVNGASHDISKQRVNRIFEQVFGYALAVDPCTHQGLAVVKSNRNALHDGRLVTCPVQRADVPDGVVYQKVVDNETGDGMVLDYRVPVHDGRIPLVYMKYRSCGIRFANENAVVRLAEPEAVFSAVERRRIRVFARRMGIDYGEFDVLRDNGDERIYIVDANSTPWGPPDGLSKTDEWMALQRLGATFKALLDEYQT